MAPKKFDKTATKFALLHRAQNDPLINDPSASSMVFAEVQNQNANRKRIPHLSDLSSEFGAQVRENEGEAAIHGIFLDDTKYDYMQHLRDLGEGGGVFIDPESMSQAGGQKKGKNKVRLEDALRDINLDGDGVSVASSMASTTSAADLFGPEMAPSEFVRKTTYQDQQDIPDALAGFQPDMDPRLREVLEALEDEAYVDEDGEEDFFMELAKEGEMPADEWEAEGDDFWEDEDGYESDRTVTPGEYQSSPPPSSPSHEPAPAVQAAADTDISPTLENPSALPPPDAAPADIPDHSDGDWLAEFSKFKKDAKEAKATKKAVPTVPADVQSILTGTSALTSGRKKKRKGALTNGSSYSMTSSALHRTDAMSLLDERFEKIEEEYAEDDMMGDFDESASMMSGITSMSKMSGISKMSSMSRATDSSQAPQLMRMDFDNIMDDFLGGHSKQGKRRIKKSGKQTGLEQLDEIRKGLGPARVEGKKTAGYAWT